MTQQITLKKGDTLPTVTFQLLQASPNDLTIRDVDTGNNSFTVRDDQTDIFTAQREFTVENSTGNDRRYTVNNSSYSNSNDETTVTVNENVADNTVDGDITFNQRIPVNISGASVKIYSYNNDKNEMLIDGDNVTIVNGDLGIIKYKFETSAVSDTGLFPTEFIVTYSDGDLTFPNNDYIALNVFEDAQGGIP